MCYLALQAGIRVKYFIIQQNAEILDNNAYACEIREHVIRNRRIENMLIFVLSNY